MNFALLSSFGYKPLESIGMIFELVVITRLPDATWTILNKKLTFFQSYQKPLKWPKAFSFEFLVSHKLYSTYGYAYCICHIWICKCHISLHWCKYNIWYLSAWACPVMRKNHPAPYCHGEQHYSHEQICSTDIDLFCQNIFFRIFIFRGQNLLVLGHMMTHFPSNKKSGYTFKFSEKRPFFTGDQIFSQNYFSHWSFPTVLW